MSDTPRRLNRPITGAAVLGVVVLFLVLILAAAYHGSNVPSPCGSARGLLRRVAADARVVSGGQATPAQLGALQRDDDDVNNLINAAQHPDPGFNGRILPLAENLGRVVTDFRDSAPVTTDLAALESAAAGATAYCGA